MKKLIAGAFGVAFMGASVLAAVPANADHGGYPRGIETKCGAFAVGKPKAFKTAKIRASAKDDSEHEPKGFLIVEVEKLNGGDSSDQRYFTRGDSAIVEMGSLKPGRYVGSVRYSPRPAGTSPFKPCQEDFNFTVNRNR